MSPPKVWCEHVTIVALRNMIGGPVEQPPEVRWCQECGSLWFQGTWHHPARATRSMRNTSADLFVEMLKFPPGYKLTITQELGDCTDEDEEKAILCTVLSIGVSALDAETCARLTLGMLQNTRKP